MVANGTAQGVQVRQCLSLNHIRHVKDALLREPEHDLIVGLARSLLLVHGDASHLDLERSAKHGRSRQEAIGADVQERTESDLDQTIGATLEVEPELISQAQRGHDPENRITPYQRREVLVCIDLDLARFDVS
jgi:hypothetical protein